MDDYLLIIDPLRHIIDATNVEETGDRYNEGFVDGLDFCISTLSVMWERNNE